MGRGRRNRPFWPFMNTPFINTFTFTFVHGSRPAKPPVHEHLVHEHVHVHVRSCFMGRGFMNTHH
eukprot:869336-Prymnesium_polylepis.1